MSYFKATMHQNRFRLGLCPRSHSGAYSAPPRFFRKAKPLTAFKEPTSRGREGKIRKKNTGKEGRKGEVRGRKGMGGFPGSSDFTPHVGMLE